MGRDEYDPLRALVYDIFVFNGHRHKPMSIICICLFIP